MGIELRILWMGDGLGISDGKGTSQNAVLLNVAWKKSSRNRRRSGNSAVNFDKT